MTRTGGRARSGHRLQRACDVCPASFKGDRGPWKARTGAVESPGRGGAGRTHARNAAAARGRAGGGTQRGLRKSGRSGRVRVQRAASPQATAWQEPGMLSPEVGMDGVSPAAWIWRACSIFGRARERENDGMHKHPSPASPFHYMFLPSQSSSGALPHCPTPRIWRASALPAFTSHASPHVPPLAPGGPPCSPSFSLAPPAP